jgi:hypothetical protein
MKACEEVVVNIHIFLTLALVGSEWSISRPGRFTLRKSAHGNHWVEGWVCTRTDLVVGSYFEN